MRCLNPCPNCFAKDRPDIKRVPGDGPRNAKVMLVGEGPGRAENSIGRPFVGPTGSELDGLYLLQAGLSRADCFVTNSFRCMWAVSSDAPPPEVYNSCAETHLKREIQEVKPEVIVLMGGIANSLAGVQSVEMSHGTWWEGELLGHHASLFSSLHPAYGLHQPSAMQKLLDDFRRLRLFLRGERGPLVDACPNPTFYRLTTASEVDDVLGPNDGFNPIAIDTESRKTWKGYSPTIRYIPWSLQFCTSVGEAFMVLVEDAAALKRLNRHLPRFRKILLWNAPHDMRVMGGMGLDVRWERVTDVMAMSYVDGRSPKSLKMCSYQLLGSSMRNFDDVVRPYGMEAAMLYYEEALQHEWPIPNPQPTGEFAESKCKGCKGTGVMSIGRGKMRQLLDCIDCGATGYVTKEKMTRKHGIGSKIQRLVGDYCKDPDAVDPWDRWENWGEDVEPLIQQMGPLPLASVERVPMEEILEYGSADAHQTLRAYYVLKQRLNWIRQGKRVVV